MSDKPASLVYGDLTPETFADFKARLRYDCKGPRGDDHCTSAALFKVENRRIIYGIDMNYTDQYAIYHDGDSESVYHSVKEYWDSLHSSHKRQLNIRMQEEWSSQFMKASEWQQWGVLKDLPGHTVTGWQEEWEYVNCHFTHAAAEAFIQRKKHDYRELRVYVDSQYWCWEFEAIKTAILNGTLVYQPKEQSHADEGDQRTG